LSLKQGFLEVANENRVSVKHDGFGNPMKAAYFTRESSRNTLSCVVGWKHKKVGVFSESVTDDPNDGVPRG